MLRLEPRINTLAIAGRNDTVNQPHRRKGLGYGLVGLFNPHIALSVQGDRFLKLVPLQTMGWCVDKEMGKCEWR